jgi:hypothetical protein
MVKAKMIAVGAAVSFFGAVMFVSMSEARILTLKECKSQFRAAKSAGYLMRTTWREFRRAHICATNSPPRAGK